ncbi:MAG: hypothetical protein M3P50_04395, partial [Actinomycetota bacterium]|nr:hypothetical protein [Actinomycetota bacterium]
MRRVLIGVLAVLLSSPGAAGAATVEVDYCDDSSRYCSNTAVVQALPGEANHLRFTRRPSAGMEVVDDGASLTAGSGCTQTDPRTVLCPDASVVSVEAGDRDDVVEMPRGLGIGGVTYDGGPGDDLLIGGDANDRLQGGSGRDRVFGGPGADLLEEGVAPAAPDADLLDGGPGIDVVSYGSRAMPVSVRLDAAGSAPQAGEAGEGDRITAMEGVVGGSGDDVLSVTLGIADDESDPYGPPFGIIGGKGDDVLTGGPGPDLIDASEGADRVDAGAGRDEVELSDRHPRPAARVACGPGVDAVKHAAVSDLLHACDSISPRTGLYSLTSLGRGAVSVADLGYPRRRRVIVRVDGGR